MDDGNSLPSPPARAQLGLARRLLTEPQPVLDELSATLGPMVGLGAGPLRVAIVGDPAALRELLTMPVASFRWNHRWNPLAVVVGSTSMIVSDGDMHRRRRGSVQAAFSRRRLTRWIPMIIDRTDLAIDRLLAAGDRPIDTAASTRSVDTDLYEVGRSLVLGIVLHALFGEAMAQRTDEFGEVFQRAQDYLERPGPRQFPHPFPIGVRGRVRADRRRFDEMVDAEISRRRTEPTGDPFDVLEPLVHDGTLSDAEIRDQVNTLIGAGFDTTAATLAWTLLRTADETSLWAALREEADHVLGDPGSTRSGVAGNDDFVALELASRTVREALRLHPAGVLSPRQAVSDLVVGGFRIPAGTLVAWSPYLAGRDPVNWKDPLRFDPDRFVDPTPEQERLMNLAWVPFGGGSRNCLGFALAQMELTLILARLAQRLDVELAGPAHPRPVGMVVNRPQGGVPARVCGR